jgi:glycosyltransferase involved in cell wall biosynthesis
VLWVESQKQNSMEVNSTETKKFRPLITVAIFTYNQERYIGEAIRGALSQTYSPLEIIISDDCSTDSTFEVIQKEVAGYAGQHTVCVNRNESNLGFGAHINKIMELAKGKIIVAAAGDDVSLPERVGKTYSAYIDANHEVYSIFSNAIVINAEGVKECLYMVPPEAEALTLESLSRSGSKGVLGCSHAWDRQVFDVFGPIDEAVINEDIVIPFRAALLGKICFIDESLVLYRQHDSNLWFREHKPTNKSQDLFKAILKGIDSRVAILQNRLRDIKTLQGVCPERHNELNNLVKTSLNLLEEINVEKQLLITSNPLKHLSILAIAFQRGVNIRRIIKWGILVFQPYLYTKYLGYMVDKSRSRRKLLTPDITTTKSE